MGIDDTPVALPWSFATNITVFCDAFARLSDLLTRRQSKVVIIHILHGATDYGAPFRKLGGDKTPETSNQYALAGFLCLKNAVSGTAL
jgi:hypothetical protein